MCGGGHFRVGTLARVGAELWQARSQEERVHPWLVCVGAESSRSFPDPMTPISSPKHTPGMRGLGPPAGKGESLWRVSPDPCEVIRVGLEPALSIEKSGLMPVGRRHRGRPASSPRVRRPTRFLQTATQGVKACAETHGTSRPQSYHLTQTEGARAPGRPFQFARATPFEDTHEKENATGRHRHVGKTEGPGQRHHDAATSPERPPGATRGRKRQRTAVPRVREHSPADTLPSGLCDGRRKLPGQWGLDVVAWDTNDIAHKSTVWTEEAGTTLTGPVGRPYDPESTTVLKGGLVSTQQHGPTAVSSDGPRRDASTPAVRRTQTRGARGGWSGGHARASGATDGGAHGGRGMEGTAHQHHDCSFPSGLGPGLPVSLDFGVSPWTRGVGPPLLPTRSQRAGSCMWGQR
ncbi:uncharacterized protein LOC125109090 [Lutra lutra]|uniref:uncharacterized protein LOC125109090 n=1 Tax=Lutra lutra TaxID=9657 RepID=UPI001FD4018B|nr:uncharacterized protein LOC125109090 [Lutra lutra]